MIIESKFNIRNNNRPDGGNGRKYQLDNVQEVVERAQWAVDKKQMFGYYGHPNTLLLKETLQNQPSNVCTNLRLNGDIVEHTQQILETDTGKVVAALHKAGAGGWSWRAGGSDGGRHSATTLKEIAGFDYVHQPSFTAITESIEDREEELKKVRHYLIDEGLSTDFADGFLSGLNDNVSKEISRLQEDKTQLREEIEMLKESLAMTTVNLKEDIDERRTIVREGLGRTPFTFKDSIIEILAGGVSNKTDLQRVLEALTSYRSVDLQNLPLTEGHAVETVKDVPFEDHGMTFDFDNLFSRR
jgi:hypothetical protein